MSLIDDNIFKSQTSNININTTTGIMGNQHFFFLH